MIIRNLTKNNVIAEEAELAASKFRRALGLSNRGDFEDFDALILKPCDQIHSTGMTFTFDALFVNSGNRIIKTYENIRPNVVIPRVEDSAFVIELPAFSITDLNIEKGDIIQVESGK